MNNIRLKIFKHLTVIYLYIQYIHGLFSEWFDTRIWPIWWPNNLWYVSLTLRDHHISQNIYLKWDRPRTICTDSIESKTKRKQCIITISRPFKKVLPAFLVQKLQKVWVVSWLVPRGNEWVDRQYWIHPHQLQISLTLNMLWTLENCFCLDLLDWKKFGNVVYL